MPESVPLAGRVCGHCDRPCIGSSHLGHIPLCHTDDPDGTDCYRLVTVYGHPMHCVVCWPNVDWDKAKAEAVQQLEEAEARRAAVVAAEAEQYREPDVYSLVLAALTEHYTHDEVTPTPDKTPTARWVCICGATGPRREFSGPQVDVVEFLAEWHQISQAGRAHMAEAICERLTHGE